MHMNKNDITSLESTLRFSEFINNGDFSFETGDTIFEAINNKNHNSDLPVLAVTQEHGAIPRDQIDYNVSVTDKSLESYKVVEIGDFIISLRSFQGGIEYSLYHGICSPAYIILRKRVPIVEQYYKYYFKSSKFIQDLNKDLEGIRDGKMISYSQFSAIMLPKPVRKEQQKIADCLFSIDDLIAAEDKKHEALKTQKKGLMQKLFPAEGKTAPEIRFEGYSDAWKQRKYSDIINLISGQDFEPSDYNDLGIGTPYMTGASCIIDAETIVNRWTEKPKCLAYQGDVLLVCKGSGYGTIARMAQKQAHIARQFMALQNLPDLDKTFNYYLAISIVENIKKDARGLIAGIARGAVLQQDVMIPSLTEQATIGDFFSNLDGIIKAQGKKIEALKLHKKGLMQCLFPSIKEVGK